MFKQGFLLRDKQLFEISEVEITRVHCICNRNTRSICFAELIQNDTDQFKFGVKLNRMLSKAQFNKIQV